MEEVLSVDGDSIESVNLKRQQGLPGEKKIDEPMITERVEIEGLLPEANED